MDFVWIVEHLIVGFIQSNQYNSAVQMRLITTVLMYRVQALPIFL